MKRRDFLAAGVGLNLAAATMALAQQSGARGAGGGGGRSGVPTRRAKTTRMFKSPGMYPNALVWHDGRLISCDAGLHPGWKGMDSPSSGYIFSIEIV